MDNICVWPQGTFPSLKVTLIHSLGWIMKYSVRVMVLLWNFFCVLNVFFNQNLAWLDMNIMSFLSFHMYFLGTSWLLTSTSELSESLISGRIYLFGQMWIFLISRFILLSLMPDFLSYLSPLLYSPLFYASFLFFISCRNVFAWVIWKIRTFLVLLVAIFSFK